MVHCVGLRVSGFRAAGFSVICGHIRLSTVYMRIRKEDMGMSRGTRTCVWGVFFGSAV